MATGQKHAVGPVGEADRISELDMLRGVALLGVLLVNIVGFAAAGYMSTADQLAALPTAGADRITEMLVNWLLRDKANTLFATLFGLGFYLQIARNGGRPGFTARFSRRLAWLLLFGIINVGFIWIWDILHLYALAGFVLLAVRNWSTRALVVTGFGLALVDVHWLEFITHQMGVTFVSWPAYSDAAVLERQAVSQAGDYWGLVVQFWRFNLADWYDNWGIVAWGLYALGRFMLGAAIGRTGVLNNVAALVPRLGAIALFTLLPGLSVGLAMALIFAGFWQPFGAESPLIAGLGRPGTALLQAAGYASLLVLAWHSGVGHSGLGRRLLGGFVPVGQMALTNYLAQGLLYGFVLFGVGPGLALAGHIGATALVAVSLAFFAGQMAFSRWWLARFRYGPMEWLWRWLTYGGARPALRRVVVAA